MANKSMKLISKAMKDIDICMMSTHGTRGTITTRPMSNNKDVDYDGDSWFFTDTKTRKVRDLKKDEDVTLAYDGGKGTYIIITGKARIIRDRNIMEQHWQPELKIWFKKGLDTPGIALLHVKANHIKYWHKYKEGEIKPGR